MGRLARIVAAPVFACAVAYPDHGAVASERSDATTARALCSCGKVQCCPELGQFELAFGRTFTGTYRTGEPFDVVTAVPDGSGPSLADAGITLRVQLVCSCPGVGPIPGIPAGEIILYSNGLCHCPAGIVADHDTDADGWTQFSGPIAAGGCASNLVLFVDGVAAGSFPIQVNSPDAALEAQCGVDAGDLAAVAERLGVPASYSICFDYNEDGAVDAGDIGAFAQALGRRCPQ